jgi:hypothetical protein
MHKLARQLPAILTLAVFTACGSESAQVVPVALSFSAPGSTASEGGAAHAVSVRLTVLDGTLAGDVTVEVVDLGTGTATDSADYPSWPTTVLTFPAGSADGDVQTVMLTTLDDSSVEGEEETLRFGLESATGAAIMGLTEHLVTIMDGDRAVIGFDVAATTTPDEAAADYTLTVEMTLSPGDSLDADVAVTAADAGSGDATAGADYAAFASQVLTFTAGTASGATQTVTLSVLDDGDYELSETAVVGLAASTGSVDLGTNNEHTVTITDDDTSPTAFLSVHPGSGAPGSSLSSGDALDLGTQTVGAGPSGSLDIQLQNFGVAPMNISVLNLTGDVGDFSIETVSAMPPPPAVLPEALFPMLAVDLTTDQGTVLELSTELLAQLATLDHVLLRGVPLPEGNAVDLALERMPSPWRADSVLAVNGVPVPGGPESVLGELSLWRGEVVDHPDSSVFLSFSEHGSAGWVRLSSLREDMLHLVSESPADAVGTPSSRLVRAQMMEAFAANPAPEVCLGAPLPPWGQDPQQLLVPDAPPVEEMMPLTVAEARLVLETDYQFHQLFGTIPAASTYVTQLIAAISDRYEKDAQATLSIAYLGLHDDPNDGWATPETPGADTGDMLAEFRGAWSSGWPAAGDLAHFISGASLGGGIAYVGVLCSQSFGFGVSANMNGAINWDTFDGSPHPLNWDFVVIAHELGHNFGANHTHSYCPPLDTCYTNCNGATSCGQGTLMSYCHLCAGGLSMITPEFHPFVANVMRNNVNSSCLGQSSIAGSGAASFTLSFEPSSAPGSKAAVLSFTHSATNEPSPFQINLSGTSTP